MIVELIGCTGAGKSTLAEALVERWPGGNAVRLHDLALAGPLRGITHPTAVNVAQEVASLPALAAAARRRAPFLSYAARTLVCTAPSPLHRANRLRGVARRVGMLELGARRERGRLVVSDEGTVLLAYMLVLDGELRTAADLERFAELVPLPDVVVHVSAPADELVRRARVRTDRQRQLGDKGTEELEELLRRTVDVFDDLVALPRIAPRVVPFASLGDGRDAERVDALIGVLQSSSTRVRPAAPVSVPAASGGPGR